MFNRFLRFRYAAIKRHSNKQWHAVERGGYIEFNPNYVVNVASADNYELTHNDEDTPFIVELSNGTRFLTYLHEAGSLDNVVGEAGEAANAASAEENYKDNRAIYSLQI